MPFTPDTIQEARKFLLPVYKPGCATGIVTVGDLVQLLCKSDDGVDKATVVAVTAVSADGRTIWWDRVATGNDPDGPIFSSDVYAVHSQHVCHCEASGNIQLLAFNQGDKTVDGFKVNGALHAVDYSPVIAGDAQLLADAINAVLLGNGHATVTSNGTAFTAYVMDTTADVSLRNLAVDVPLVAF